MFRKSGICLLFIPLCIAHVLENKVEDIADIENVTESVPNYDYIVKLAYNLEEKKVPQYIIDLIYDQPLEKVIYTDDIISLLGLRKLTIQQTLDILQVIDTPPERLFSLDGLDQTLKELNLSFKDFYNSLKSVLNLGGAPLRNALVSLGIDSGTFSDALAYGDPDPFEEFKKGDFTRDSLETACSIAGISVEDLYGGARNVVLVSVGNLPPNKLIAILNHHGVNRATTRRVWDALNVTLQDVYNVETFKNLFNEIDAKIKAQLTLGVINDKSSIAINRKVYDIWKNEKQLLTIYAESIEANTILSVQEISDQEFKNIVTLKYVPVAPDSEADVSFLPIGFSEKNILNCQYITLQNGDLVIKDVEKAVYHRKNSYYEIPKYDIDEVVLGSPLVCEHKVFGIARDITEANILLDSYSSGSAVVSRVFIVLLSAFLSCYVFLS